MLNYKVYKNQIADKAWVVLVHGFSGDMSFWHDQVNCIKKLFNVLLLDLPWHGKSVIEKKLTEDVLNTEIKKVLDKEHIGKAHFIGLSLGTVVVSQFILRFPQYVEKIIFVGSVIQVRPLCKAIIGIAEPIRDILPYRLLCNFGVSLVVPKGVTNYDGEILKRGFAKMGRDKLIEWVSYLGVILKGKEVMTEIKKLNKNILFLSGERDLLFLKGAAESSDILGEKISVMKGCTHLCNADNVELFNKKIIHFLTYGEIPKRTQQGASV